MRRGEVRWYKFSPPDKRRPVLVLTRDSAIEFLGEVTIAPVTMTIRDIPSEVSIGPADGMPKECAVNLDHIQTVSKGRIEGVITTLSSSRMHQVQRALEFALGFSQPGSMEASRT